MASDGRGKKFKKIPKIAKKSKKKTEKNEIAHQIGSKPTKSLLLIIFLESTSKISLRFLRKKIQVWTNSKKMNKITNFSHKLPIFELYGG